MRSLGSWVGGGRVSGVTPCWIGRGQKRAHIVYMRDGERRQWRGGSGFVVAHGGERGRGRCRWAVETNRQRWASRGLSHTAYVIGRLD